MPYKNITINGCNKIDRNEDGPCVMRRLLSQ